MPKRGHASEVPLRRSSRGSTMKEVKDESSTDTELVDTPRKKTKTSDGSAGRVTVKQESFSKDATDLPAPSAATRKASKKATPRKVKVEKADTEEEETDLKGVATLPPPLRKKEKSAADLAAQKLKKLTSFVSSPYPNFAHPTPEECRRVVDLLSRLHGPAVRPTGGGKPIDDKSAGAACGQVPSVLDALVRTVLSQNTTSKNSTAAKANLDATFGKGNWAAMHDASSAALEDAIRIGGLAPSKTATIKTILATAHDKYGAYSLDHLHNVSNETAMAELISFKGVGPKTASCVLLFCMARDSFAVDTHVFRLAKSLNWVPKTAGREETYGHLDIKIPGEYKYPLHSLLITHGKRCGRCSAHRKSGLLPASDCPLIGISKTMKEVDLQQAEEEEEEEDVVVTEPKVPEELTSTMVKLQNGTEAKGEDGMAIE